MNNPKRKRVCTLKHHEDLEWAFYQVLREIQDCKKTIGYLTAQRDALSKLVSKKFTPQKRRSPR